MASIQPTDDSSIQPIDLDECLKDSPKFRHLLKENLNYIDRLEACMEKTVKHCNQSIESGKSYLKAQSAFVGSLTDLSECFEDDREISVRLDTLLIAFREIIRLQTIIVDQAGRTIGCGISKFIQDDLSKLKDTRKSFEKISHDNDQILTRCSQPLKKQGDDSENLLIATSTAFRHTSLDLSIQLTTLQSRKGYEVLDSVLSFTKAYGTFFHQGSDLFDDLKPYISATHDLLTKRQDICESLIRSLPSKHLMVSGRNIEPQTFKCEPNDDRVHLEGYLFKRASNAFKVWNRRWFILEDHQLLYQKRGDIQPTVMEEDLRLCTVRLVDRPDIERRFCFEVVSPQKNHILQADSEKACQMWISTIQAGINAAYHDVNHHYTNNTVSVNQRTGYSQDVLNQKMTQSASQDSFKTETSISGLDQSPSSSSEPSSTSGSFRAQQNDLHTHNLDNYITNGKFLASCDISKATTNQAFSTNNMTNVIAPLKPQRAYSRILALPGNELCCDCGCPEPKWASINLGITLCIECSGIHRSLGVHVSKVRSLTLDTDVWTPETVQFMVNLGNVKINSIYLAMLEGEQRNLICATSSRQEREAWIREKYLTKKYVTSESCETELQEQSTSSAPGKSDNADITS